MKVEKYFNHVKKDNYIFLKRFLISILKIYDFHQYIQQKRILLLKTKKLNGFFFHFYATIRIKSNAYVVFCLRFPLIYLFIHLFFAHHAFLKFIYVRIINKGNRILHCYCSLNSLLVRYFDANGKSIIKTVR